MSPSKPSVLFAILSLAHLVGPQLAAQVRVEATTATVLRVKSSEFTSTDEVHSTNTVRAGMDITSGVDVINHDARLTLSTQRERSRIVVNLIELASGQAFPRDNLYLPLHNWTRFEGSVGPHGIVVEFSSPQPMRATLTVKHCRDLSGILATGYQGQVAVIGHGAVSSGLSCETVPNSRTFDVVIGSSPLVAIFDTEGFATTSRIPTSMRAEWELELVPDPGYPAEVESYGEACGATLTAMTDFDHPGELVVTLEDPSVPQVAVLTFGTTRESLPIPGQGCMIHQNVDAVLTPWPVDSKGRAVLVIDPPPIPGLSFKMQAATLQGVTIHTTNALDVVVRH